MTRVVVRKDTLIRDKTHEITQRRLKKNQGTQKSPTKTKHPSVDIYKKQIHTHKRHPVQSCLLPTIEDETVELL